MRFYSQPRVAEPHRGLSTLSITSHHERLPSERVGFFNQYTHMQRVLSLEPLGAPLTSNLKKCSFKEMSYRSTMADSTP
jgi:hypothetical protein